MELPDIMRSILADSFGFYYRAHQAHWNVVGPDFSQYHSLFGQIADDVYGSIDPLAEVVRKLDAFTPVSLAELTTMCNVGMGGVKFDTASLAADLLAHNESMLGKLKMAFVAADAQNEQGIANLIAERIDQHQKWRWFLKSSTSATIDLGEIALVMGGLAGE